MSLEQDIRKLDNKRFGAAIKDTECTHHRWTKRCSICGTIIETEQNILVEGQTKLHRNELEKLVTSYEVSQLLKHSGIHSTTQLFWVHFITSDYKCIRAKENLTLNNTEIFPAYTVQELCKLLKKYEVEADVIYENCENPDALAHVLKAIYNLE